MASPSMTSFLPCERTSSGPANLSQKSQNRTLRSASLAPLCPRRGVFRTIEPLAHAACHCGLLNLCSQRRARSARERASGPDRQRQTVREGLATKNVGCLRNTRFDNRTSPAEVNAWQCNVTLAARHLGITLIEALFFLEAERSSGSAERRTAAQRLRH